jgi:hypothetical protein
MDADDPKDKEATDVLPVTQPKIPEIDKQRLWLRAVVVPTILNSNDAHRTDNSIFRSSVSISTLCSLTLFFFLSFCQIKIRPSKLW